MMVMMNEITVLCTVEVEEWGPRCVDILFNNSMRSGHKARSSSGPSARRPLCWTKSRQPIRPVDMKNPLLHISHILYHSLYHHIWTTYTLLLLCTKICRNQKKDIRTLTANNNVAERPPQLSMHDVAFFLPSLLYEKFIYYVCGCPTHFIITVIISRYRKYLLRFLFYQYTATPSE